MKSNKISVPPSPPITYPCLKEYKDTGLVVLFIATHTGVVVHSGKDTHELGRYSNSWGEYNFIPFHGSITLETE